MELGIFSFGELTPIGVPLSAHQRLANVIDAAVTADEAGLDVFGVGEHHRADFAVSATAVVLGAIAARTTRIRLTSAVTVLSAADPVRVFEDYATLDLLSGGRAEIIVGRSAFSEPFPMFGVPVEQIDERFAENLDLLLRLRIQERITWSGRFRSPLVDIEIAPRPLQSELPVWIGVGGSPPSAARAGRLGLPLTLAIIGGDPAQFVPLINYYRNSGVAAGHQLNDLPVCITSHMHIAATSQAARDEFFPHYAAYFMNNAPRRGAGFHIGLADYEMLAGPNGSLFVGSPAEIIDKLGRQHELFASQRFLAQIGVGGVPHVMATRAITLFATEVAPIVRRELTPNFIRVSD